jgi:glycosyltransferase involved in cell wall biosynthesis
MEKFIYIAQFTDASGYANAARKYLYLLDKYLDKSNYELRVYNSSYESKNSCSHEEMNLIKKYELSSNEVEAYVTNNTYKAIFHLLPHGAFDTSGNHKNTLIYKYAKEKINICYWETDRIPLEWRKIFANKVYDKLVLASQWNKETFSKDCALPIHIVPVPVISSGSNKKISEIFNIFSLSQWIPRKGFDILIRAFYLEFFENEDVKLFIKTYRDEARGTNPEGEKNIIFQQAKEYKAAVCHYDKQPRCRLEIKTGVEAPDLIERYYDSADIFALVSRGEGFSIPLAEAVMRGIPTISPNLGGHIDFLEKESNFFVSAEYTPLANASGGSLFSSIEMNSVEANLNSLRACLRESYNLWKNEKQALLEMGEKARRFAGAYFDEKTIFLNFLSSLDS